jgi:hypothetical protein
VGDNRSGIQSRGGHDFFDCQAKGATKFVLVLEMAMVVAPPNFKHPMEMHEPDHLLHALLMIIICVLFLLLFSYLNSYKKLLECEKIY